MHVAFFWRRRLCTFFSVFPLLKIFWRNCRKQGQGSFERPSPTLTLSSWTKWRRNFLSQQWLCQKPLITSLNLSSQITKQYSHGTSGRAEPKHSAALGAQRVLTGSRSLREEPGRPPTWARAMETTAAGYTWLRSVIPRIRESRHLYRIPGTAAQKKVISPT